MFVIFGKDLQYSLGAAWLALDRLGLFGFLGLGEPQPQQGRFSIDLLVLLRQPDVSFVIYGGFEFYGVHVGSPVEDFLFCSPVAQPEKSRKAFPIYVICNSLISYHAVEPLKIPRGEMIPNAPSPEFHRPKPESIMPLREDDNAVLSNDFIQIRIVGKSANRIQCFLLYRLHGHPPL